MVQLFISYRCKNKNIVDVKYFVKRKVEHAYISNSISLPTHTSSKPYKEFVFVKLPPTLLEFFIIILFFHMLRSHPRNGRTPYFILVCWDEWGAKQLLIV